MTRGGARALLRAVTHAQAGRLASARAEVQAALASDAEDGALLLAAAHVLHVTRDHQWGLDALRAARARVEGEAPRILRREVAVAEALGWEREVARACAEGRVVAPRDPAWDALELAMHRRGGDDEAALVAAERALERAPRWAALAMERAAILGRLGRGEAAVAAVEAALGMSEEVAYRCEAARVLTAVGAFARAEAQWRAALAGGATAAAGALAELCLRVGDREGARGWAGRLTGAAALRVAGAVDMSLGTWSSGLVNFERALAAEADAGTQLWRAEALLRLGRDVEAGEALTAAGVGGREDNFVAGMLRLLLVARARPEARVRPAQVEGFAGALVEMGLGEGLHGTLAAGAAAVEAALRRMRGSREAPLSWHAEDVPGDRSGEDVPGDRSAEDVPGDRLAGLRRFAWRGGPRFAARAVLGTIRGGAAGRVLAGFERVIAAYPGSGLPVCHRGELRLWLGDVDGAVADLDAALAIAAHTRWAYIGRTMAALLRDDPSAALEEDARGVAVMGGEGPAVYVHRGEALRRLGRPAEAIVALRRAVALHPGRIGAWLNLGLAYAASGQHEGLGAVFERLRERCPGLVSDAARSAAIVAWPDAGGHVPAGQQEAVLARALALLRGNRSASLVTYFTDEGQLRVAQDGAPAGRGPHVHDDRDLLQAARLVRGRG